MTKNNSKLTLINASAGTGKTYTLVERIYDQIDGTIATTFTNKAAAELKSRIRKKLLEKGQDATTVLNGNIGTVNSVFGKMVSDNAFALGISPETGIITEEAEENLFKAATADVIGSVSDEKFTRAVKRFGRQDDWFKDVKEICIKCRQNGITDLTESAKASFDFFDRLLPYPGNEKEIKEKTDEELQKLITAGRSTVLSFENKKIGDLIVKDWITLSSIKEKYAGDLRTAAEKYLALPSLRDDLKIYINTVFDCAKKCLDAYATAKKELGVVDFIDQETMALDLLKDDKRGKVPAERVERLYVDEFQDTSPIQLALFSQLRKTSNAESVYVGDPKQAIYKFRGTDPKLTMNIRADKNKTLKQSFRTVKPAVNFVNSVFLEKFTNAGMKKKNILITKYDREESVCSLPPVQIWSSFKLKNSTTPCYEAVARQIKKLLASGVEIFDKGTKENRTIRGSDIAVFFRTNPHIRHFAAVAEQYFKVSASSGKLLDCETGIFLNAVLTLLIDNEATLAKAQILKALGKFNSSEFDEENEIFDELNDLRKHRSNLTPTEILDDVLTLAFVRNYFEKRCHDTEQAYAEADAFRGAVADYEDMCDETRTPATLEDFLLQIDADAPASRDKDAVAVLTYHAAKGLEWNVTVCMDCEKYEKDYPKDIFTVHVLGDADADTPLKNRKILFLPHFFAKKKKPSPKLEELLLKDETGIVEELTKQAKEEHDRLMYVGMTRARDCLILHKACSKSTDPKTKEEIIKSSFYCDDDMIKACKKTEKSKNLPSATMPMFRYAVFPKNRPLRLRKAKTFTERRS